MGRFYQTTMIDRRKARVIAADYVDKWRDDPRMRMQTINRAMIDSLMDHLEQMYDEVYRSGYESALNPQPAKENTSGEPSE